MSGGARITAEGEMVMDMETVNIITGSISEENGPFSDGKKGGMNSIGATPGLIPGFEDPGIRDVDVHFLVNSNRIRAICTLHADSVPAGKIQALMCVSASLLSIWNSVRDLESLKRKNYQFASLKNISVTSVSED
jgi:molybdenum cofactor biosynthesis enzyme